MAPVMAELRELEAELQETFEEEEWTMLLADAPDIVPVEGAARGVEIRMDLNTLGGSRPRPN